MSRPILLVLSFCSSCVSRISGSGMVCDVVGGVRSVSLVAQGLGTGLVGFGTFGIPAVEGDSGC